MKKLARTGATFTTVVAGAAVIAVVGTGSAVAGSLITSAKIKDGTIQSIDVKNNNLKGKDLLDGTLTGADVANGSLTGADIKDFSLSNQDAGVLFAQVNADATVANSSGGVTATQPFGTGTYEVDFGRDITSCAFVASVGNAVAGGATGAAVQVTDRSSNAEAVFVRTADRTGTTDTDKPFQLVVVC